MLWRNRYCRILVDSIADSSSPEHPIYILPSDFWSRPGRVSGIRGHSRSDRWHYAWRLAADTQLIHTSVERVRHPGILVLRFRPSKQFSAAERHSPPG